MSDKKYILNKEASARKLHRMALELAEQLNGDLSPVILIGIRNSGMVIAEKVGALLRNYVSNEVRIISASLDKNMPREVELSEHIDFNGLHVVVADDVTNSGRTLSYVLKPLLQYYPRSIRTLVLVERMHKLFPVKPDYVGSSVATLVEEHIHVEVENGEVTGAYVI